MQLAKTILGAGLLGLGLCGAEAGALAQTASASQNQVPDAQNRVPDAPRPQTLPQLNTIVPTAPAVPGAALPSTPASATSGTALPNAALPTAPIAQPDAAAEADTVTGTDSGPNPPATTPGAPDQPQDAGTGAPPVAHESSLVVRVNFVEIPFTVKDSRHVLVPGLTPRDVQVYENGLRQHIALFTADPKPLAVALVIDQSVTFDTMRKVNASLSALQAAFTPYDEISIFTYNNGVTQQSGFSGAQSTLVTFALEHSKGAGREPLMPLGGPLGQTTVKNNLAVDPNTNGVNNGTLQQSQNVPREYHTLNDAILTAAETVAKAGKQYRRMIYVISDGKEYGSQAKSKEVIRYLQSNEISVYATLVGDSAIPGEGFLDRIHLPLTMRDDGLPRYAAATGGECDPEFRPQSIENNFAKLAEQVRTQYTVGYYSHESLLDGKYRTLDVRVMKPSLDVVAKPGYYPSASMAVGNPSRPSASAAAPAAAPAATRP